jgi:sulfur carrier protein
MKVKINGEEKEIESHKNVLNIIEDCRLNKDAIVIEYNMDVLDKNKYNDTYIKDGDQIEIVRFMGGG